MSSFFAALGAADPLATQLDRLTAGGRTVGRVTRAERSAVTVAVPVGATTASLRHRTEVVPTVGDWVVVDEGLVTEVLPRSSTVARGDVRGRSVEHVLAANVDLLLVCVPLEPRARLGRAERLLALAWSSGATPVLVATKADLCPPGERDAALELLAGAAPGVEVRAVSTYDGSAAGVRGLAGPGRTLAMLGASGVGKSTLANTLLGSDELVTAEIRGDGKGRHTTAWRELVVLPGGGALIDTPGLRAVGLHASADGVERVFADVVELAERCRFADCRHETEPGCAVSEALDAGELDVDRLESHRKLQRELVWQQAKTDARLRAERTREWKARARQQRARPFHS